MIIEEIKQIKTGRKNLRSFGITFGVIVILIAAFLFYKEKESFLFIFYIGLAFIGLGLMMPILLKPIFLIWMVFSLIIGLVMTKFILTLLFYLIVTPIGVISKLFGEDFLGLEKEIFCDSYWNLRDSNMEKNQNYKNQF